MPGLFNDMKVNNYKEMTISQSFKTGTGMAPCCLPGGCPLKLT